jgi:hypothetical protein
MRLLKGIRPSAALLKKYAIPLYYGNLIHALYNGSISEYRNLLDDNSEELIKIGVYFLFERLEWVCLRTLFRNMYVPFCRLTNTNFLGGLHVIKNASFRILISLLQ